MSASLRLDGYVRVSRVGGREGDSFISPAVQRDRIASYTRAYGHELLEVFEELDESGARGDRPKLLRAIERVERGESDGLVVAKLDRFGRSLVDGLQLIERIRGAGGTFISVADGFDLTTDTGRLVLRIMLSLAEFELDRVRGNWQDAKARAVERGIHPSATPPFGYRRGSDKRLEVDPITGPLVTELFQLRAGGEGYTALGRWLASRGARTQWGRENWSLRAVKDIIRNDAYLGVASAGDLRNEDAHEPLTDQVTFRRAQRPGARTVPRSAEPPVLAPILRCGSCRYVMRINRRQRAHGDVWVYSCKTGSATSWKCDQPAHIIDNGSVEAWVTDRFLDALPELVARAHGETPRLRDLERAAGAARGAFEQWRDDSRVQQQLGMDAYLDGLRARQAADQEAHAALDAELARAGAGVIPADAASVREQWPGLSAGQRRLLLASTIRCVFVRPSSRHLALADRLHVVWAGQPVDLPARGYRGFVARPWPFDDVDADAPEAGVPLGED